MISNYQAETLWQGQLKQASRTDTSWPFKAQIIPIAFISLFLLANDFNSSAVSQSLIILTISFVEGIVTYGFLSVFRKRKSTHSKVWATVLLSQFNTMLGILASIIAFRLAVDAAGEFSNSSSSIQLGSILLISSAWLFGLFIAPSSIPKTESEVRDGITNIKLLPWVLGIQAGVISIGTFVAAWFLHDTSRIGFLLVAALMTILSSLLGFLSILGFWRFLMLLRTRDRAPLRK